MLAIFALAFVASAGSALANENLTHSASALLALDNLASATLAVASLA